MQPVTSSWTPPVVTCSALNRTGLDAIWEIVQKHHEKMRESGELQQQRQEQALQWMWALIEEGLKDRFYRHPAVRERLPDLASDVRRGRITPTKAAGHLLFLLDNKGADNKGI
jgi:LAO/AO transport system kinase